MMGPYETERDALREPMPREVRTAQTAGTEQHDVTGLRLIGAGADIAMRHLADACNAAGVEIADYDRRILAWLSRWEPSTAQVVIGLITRAHEAGRASETGKHSRIMAGVVRDVWRLAQGWASDDDTEPIADSIFTAMSPLLAWEEENGAPSTVDDGSAKSAP